MCHAVVLPLLFGIKTPFLQSAGRYHYWQRDAQECLTSMSAATTGQIISFYRGTLGRRSYMKVTAPFEHKALASHRYSTAV